MRSHLRRAVDSRSSTGDTIEVSSPGEPVAPITLEELQDFSAPTLSRNPKIHYIFNRMGLAEERGLGMKTLKLEIPLLYGVNDSAGILGAGGRFYPNGHPLPLQPQQLLKRRVVAEGLEVRWHHQADTIAGGSSAAADPGSEGRPGGGRTVVLL